MAPIQTYVFLDTETTGLPTRKDGVPGVTELGMLAINHKHFLERKANEEIRVQHKLLVFFNPCKEMSKESVKLSGLNNQLLEQEGHFNMDSFNTINSFINSLQKPVCLIAHKGLEFHFPILKYYFANMGKDVQLSPELKCTDSLYAFYDLLEAEKLGNKSNMNQEKSYVQLYRTRFYNPNSVPVDSYVLNQVYQRVVDGAHLKTNRAENHCVMILEIASGRAERFVQWVNAKNCPFSEVPNQPVPQN